MNIEFQPMKHVNYNQLYQITYPVTIIDHQNESTGNEIYSVAPGEINVQYHL